MLEIVFIDKIFYQINNLNEFLIFFEFLYLIGKDNFWELSTLVFYDKFDFLNFQQ